MNYDFEVIYRPGPKHSAADALSRNPIPQENFPSEEMPRSILYDLAEKKLLPETSSESDSPNFLLAKESTITDFSDELENNYDSDSFSEYSSESDSSVHNFCHNKKVTFQVSSDSENSITDYNQLHIYLPQKEKGLLEIKKYRSKNFSTAVPTLSQKKRNENRF